jgi:hypothetical protein
MKLTLAIARIKNERHLTCITSQTLSWKNARTLHLSRFSKPQFISSARRSIGAQIHIPFDQIHSTILPRR